MHAFERKRAMLWALTAVAVACVAAGAGAQSMRPPAPDVAASDLRHPDPVGTGRLPILEVLPPQLPFAFFLSLNQEALAGEWDVRGTVDEVDKDRMIVKTDNDGEARLLYRLPDEQTLGVDPGAPVSIERNVLGNESSFGFLIGILSNDRILALGGQVHGPRPQTVESEDGKIKVEQRGERIAELGQSEFERTYAIETVLHANGESIPLTMGEPVQVALGQNLLQVELLNSTEVVPEEKFEGLAEGSGFALEFAITQVLFMADR